MAGQKLWVLAPDRRADALLAGLAGMGHAIVRHADRSILQAQWVAHAGDGAPVLLLMADAVENSLCAAWLRDRDPWAAVMAFTREGSQAEQMVLVQAGVNWIARFDDTPELLAAILDGWRQRRVAPLDGGAPRLGVWRLCQEGWLLAHEDGARLRLSAAERALVRCLFDAPGHQAMREALTRAILDAWQGAPMRQRRQDVNLPVLVGRLRAKGRAAGLLLPIQSVRGAAYAWVH